MSSFEFAFLYRHPVLDIGYRVVQMIVLEHWNLPVLEKYDRIAPSCIGANAGRFARIAFDTLPVWEFFVQK